MHPLAFFAHQLSPTEHNYNMGRWELLVVKLALEEWRKLNIPLLFGWPREPAKWSNSLQARWSFFWLPSLTIQTSTSQTRGAPMQMLSPPKESEPILPASLVVGSITWKIESVVCAAQQNECPVVCNNICDSYRMAAMACADEVMVIIMNQENTERLNYYKKRSSAEPRWRWNLWTFIVRLLQNNRFYHWQQTKIFKLWFIQRSTDG